MSLVEEIIRQVCREFRAEREDVVRAGTPDDNFLTLMAMSLSVELLDMPGEDIAKAFDRESVSDIGRAPLELRRYFRMIPGLANKYEKIKTRIIGGIYGF